jgi:MFS transporter, DHA2 family, multidrug resistance protein
VIGVDTNIWVLEILLLMQGIGLANVVAPATNSILSVVPQAKAGAGAAVNNTVRQVGGALGVAVIGTVLASTYGSHLGSAVNQLPAQVRATAQESIGATQQILAKSPPTLRASVEPAANDAYITALHDAALVSAAGALLGAIAAAIWLPGKKPDDDETAGPARAPTRSDEPAPARRS